MTYRNRKIERNALNFLQTLPPHLLQFPFDILASIETLNNCKIHSYQDFAKKHNTYVDNVINFCQSETGCTHKVSKNFIIMFNDSNLIIKERKIFTLAHELGHIILNHFDNTCHQQIAQGGSINKIFEREANYFAACLLCPLPIVYNSQTISISELQKKFNLSYEAAEIAWNDYKNYNRNYHIPWHNDIIRLFNV